MDPNSSNILFYPRANTQNTMANRPNVIVKNLTHGRDGSFQDAIIGGSDVSEDLFNRCVIEFCNRFDIMDVKTADVPTLQYGKKQSFVTTGPNTLFIETLADGKRQCIVTYKMVAHYYKEFKFDPVSLRPDVVVEYDSHSRDGTYHERIVAKHNVTTEQFNKCLETFRDRTDITDLNIDGVELLPDGRRQCAVSYQMIQHHYKEYEFN